MIIIFLIILYSTKFYTYVNELTFSINKNLFDEYFQLYLLWTSYLFAIFYIFRFQNISRFYLFLFSFIIPSILLTFRNTELLSSVLGRSINNENYLSVNLDENSNFKNLRIMNFRKSLGNISHSDFLNSSKLIESIDKVNKLKKINLIVINLDKVKEIENILEEYLIETNKKILIISKEKPKFTTKFLFRQEVVDTYYFTYFNNDIQYGSKYILKRIFDILLSIFGILIFSPVMFLLFIYISIIDGFPFYVKQKRVGLHGEVFNMFKFQNYEERFS